MDVAEEKRSIKLPPPPSFISFAMTCVFMMDSFVLQSQGIAFASKASTSFVPSDLQVYVVVTNATLDNMQAHLQSQREAHQRLEAKLENTDMNIALGNKKTSQIQETLICV